MTFNDLVEAVETFEGFRSVSYLDAAGVITIGYGRTGNVSIGEVTTRAKEKEWLISRLNSDMCKVQTHLNNCNYKYNDNILYALTDFTYNCGIANLFQLTQYGDRSLDEVANKILSYNKARVNGKLTELAGLTKRRTWERNIMLSQDITNSIPSYPDTILGLQQYLNDHFNAGLKCDGIFGKNTFNAIKELTKK